MATTTARHLNSVANLLQQTRLALQSSSDAPDLDAERLLLHAVGRSESSWLYTHGDYCLTTAQISSLKNNLSLRQTGMPLAYILGEAYFYGRKFFVGSSVLIPRPTTEEVVDRAIDYLRHLIDKKNANQIINVTDIGTGSGCIIISLALELQSFFDSSKNKFRYFATDISGQALRCARENARRHKVAEQISFRQGNMLEPLADVNIDLIVSNPPYLPVEELRQLAEAKAGCAPETSGLLFEPHVALDGGPDGQKYTAVIMSSARPAIIETTGGIIATYLPNYLPSVV